MTRAPAAAARIATAAAGTMFKAPALAPAGLPEVPELEAEEVVVAGESPVPLPLPALEPEPLVEVA